MKVKVTSTIRDVDTQDALYAQGRTKPGQIVTYVQGGDSWHNYGLAFDLVITFPDGRPDWRSALFDEIGAHVAATYPSVTWGGTFPALYGGTFVDRPHYEFHLNGIDNPRALPFGPVYPTGQCTWLVAKMERELLGTEHFTFKKYPGLPDRDAKMWDDLYDGAQGTTPKVNSVAQWETGTYGHVAWVTAVHPDNTFDVTESNYHLDGKVGTRTHLSPTGVRFLYP